MSRIVFLNGSFLPIEEAKVPSWTAASCLATEFYEGVGMLDGRLIDNEAHLERLERSLGEVRIANPYSKAEWTALQEELARRNGMTEGFIYFQVTRGVAERDFFFPENAKPTVAMFTQAKAIANAPAAEKGIAVVTVPDLRWQRRDINRSTCSRRFSPSRRPRRPERRRPGWSRTDS